MPALLDASSGTKAITVVVEADAVQRGEQRIQVDLVLRNDGPGSVRVLNPFDMVQFIVLDANGFPRRVPRPVPSLLVNRQTQANWHLRTAVPVMRVVHSGQEDSLAAIDRPILELGSGESYVVQFGIDHFEPEPEPTGSRPPAPAEAPAWGDYSVDVMLNLINADDTKDSRIVRTEPVRVQLAPGAHSDG